MALGRLPSENEELFLRWNLTDCSIIGCACTRVVSTWTNRRQLQLNIMSIQYHAFQDVCMLDTIPDEQQAVMEYFGGMKVDFASHVAFVPSLFPRNSKKVRPTKVASLADYREVVDHNWKTDGPFKMAISKRQSCNANQVILPQPALHSCDESKHNTNNRGLMEENLPHLPQSSDISEVLYDMLKPVSSQNPILSDKEPRKSKIVSDRTVKLKSEIESAKTSAEDNEIVQLPESNMVNHQAACDLKLQTIDEEDESVESNDTELIDDEMLEGTDKCRPRVRIAECKAERQISTDIMRRNDLRNCQFPPLCGIKILLIGKKTRKEQADEPNLCLLDPYIFLSCLPKRNIQGRFHQNSEIDRRKKNDSETYYLCTERHIQVYKKMLIYCATLLKEAGNVDRCKHSFWTSDLVDPPPPGDSLMQKSDEDDESAESNESVVNDHETSNGTDKWRMNFLIQIFGQDLVHSMSDFVNDVDVELSSEEWNLCTEPETVVKKMLIHHGPLLLVPGSVDRCKYPFWTSNLVDPPPGDSIMQKSDEDDESAESNESVVNDHETSNGTDKWWKNSSKFNMRQVLEHTIISDFVNDVDVELSSEEWNLCTEPETGGILCQTDDLIEDVEPDLKHCFFHCICWSSFHPDPEEREKERLSQMYELLKLLIGANCGKVQVPPMDPVWITGQNMTLEEKNWEHILFCYDKGNRLENFESVIVCINPIAICDGNIRFEVIKVMNVISVKRPLKDATATGSQGVSFTEHQCEISQSSTEEICHGLTEEIIQGPTEEICHGLTEEIIQGPTELHSFFFYALYMSHSGASSFTGKKVVFLATYYRRSLLCLALGLSHDETIACKDEVNEEELLSNDEKDTIITSSDNYLAEYNKQIDSLSLMGTRRIDNSFVRFFNDFRSKVWKLQYRMASTNLKSPIEITKSVENGNIDYDEDAFDTVGISLKKNYTGQIYPRMFTFNDKRKISHWLLSKVTEDFCHTEHHFDQEMSHAAFSAAVTPANIMRCNRSKIVDVDVIEQSCTNFEGSKYKLAIDDDKQLLRAFGDEGCGTTKLASLVTDYFNDNQQQQNKTTVAAEENSNLIETNVKEAESLNERLCNRKKTNPSEKNEDLADPVDHCGNMAEIRAMSLVLDFDLPFPRIDSSYLSTLVYRIEEPLLTVIDRLASDNPPTPHISMRYELLRFCTLRTYPRGDKPYLIRLAAAGFYYASDGDGVVCYCCGSRRYNWTGREDPMKVHLGIKPSCKFLTKNEDVNVPVVYNGPLSKSLTGIEAIPEPKVITQEGENVNREYAPERKRNQESVNEQQTLGINNATPKHSQYTIKSQRLASYKDWPKTSKLKPEELADAGFFYAGFGDCVRCFFCGIGLRHWSDDDDPWIEHARWARTCVFVRQKKGEEFVNLVQLAVQLTQDNGQAGATVEGSANNNSLPVSTIEKLLLSKAALSAAELGFHTEIIKRAVEEMIRNGVIDNISPDDLLCKVLEIEGRDERAAAAAAGTATSWDTNKGNGSENKSSVSSSAEPSKKETANGDEKTKTDNTKKQSDKTEKTKLDKGNDSDSLQDPVAIKHENEVLKEQTLCKVCLDNTVCIVFLPCGHLVTCADCAPAMRKCPICRALVRGTVRTYMS